MANLLDWNTLDHKVKSFIDPEDGIDTPQKAFPILMVSTILNLSDEEARDSITDGGNDRGVDAVYVDERDGRNSIHVFQFKYVENYEKTKNNFPSNEIDKLVSFFHDLLDQDQSLESTCNPILWNKIREVWDALNRRNPCIEVHFCGNLNVMQEVQRVRADSSFNKFKYFNVHHHSMDTISALLIEQKKPRISRELPIVDKDYFDRTDGVVRGLICTVEAAEIVKMIRDPEDHKSIDSEIFDDNVRVYLTRNNKINKKIIDTALSEDSNLFWYFNNGITITCESFSYPKGKRAPIVSLTNMQIVNGGQTSHALFEAYQEDEAKLDDVLVLVRVIETKLKKLSNSIAETTNSQTPIKGRDLRSNDAIQKKLEEAFAGMGLFYERKTKQHEEEARTLRIDALTAGQAYLAYGLGFPEVAKKDRGRIFGDLYETIFTDEITADELLVAYRVLEIIEKEKRDIQRQIKVGSVFDKSKLFLIDGGYHVVFAVAELCRVHEVDPNDLLEVVKQVPRGVSLVSEVVSSEQKIDEVFSFNRFFKDAKTRRKITAAAIASGGVHAWSLPGLESPAATA